MYDMLYEYITYSSPAGRRPARRGRLLPGGPRRRRLPLRDAAGLLRLPELAGRWGG